MLRQAQNQLLSDRMDLIRELAAKHDIRGFDRSPLEKEKIQEFTSRLSDMQRAKITETDNIQVFDMIYNSTASYADNLLKIESKAVLDDYAERLRTLDADLQRHKHRKETLREKLVCPKRTPSDFITYLLCTVVAPS